MFWLGFLTGILVLPTLVLVMLLVGFAWRSWQRRRVWLRQRAERRKLEAAWRPAWWDEEHA